MSEHDKSADQSSLMLKVCDIVLDKGSVCVALHPGTVETPFTANYAGRHKTMPASEAARALVDVLLSVLPEQSGGFFDYAGKEVPW